MKTITLSTEEKILTLIPVLFALIDYIATFTVATNLTVLMANELNAGVKYYTATHGVFGLFGWLVVVFITVFIFSLSGVYIYKYAGIDIKYLYAFIFLYCGMRIDALLSWFPVLWGGGGL